MTNEQVQQIFVEDIIPNRYQPRLTFDEKALEELSISIKEHGVIQPLVVRRVSNKYEIIAGERRYKAACLAGLKTVPAIVRDMNDTESAEVALIENIQRKNLTSIEEAQSYKNLLDRGYMTQDELAKKLGVSQSTIANKLRLLNLSDEVQNALLNGKISERHARSLLQLENFESQKKMLDRIIIERLTVKQLDDEIKKMLEESSSDEGINLTPTSINITEDMLNSPIFSDNTLETGGKFMIDKSSDEPVKNIFGMEITKNTDLEDIPTNLDTAVEDTIPPVSFNPFATSIENRDNIKPVEEEKIETFDLFGGSLLKEQNEPIEEIETVSKRNLGESINKVRETIRTIETNGFIVELEEYDFEDVYQIVIKIKK